MRSDGVTGTMNEGWYGDRAYGGDGARARVSTARPARTRCSVDRETADALFVLFSEPFVIDAFRRESGERTHAPRRVEIGE